MALPVFHDLFEPLLEVFRIDEWLFRVLGAPYFDGVVHADETNVLFDFRQFEVAFGYEHTPVAVERYQFGINDKLSEHGLLLAVPAIQLLSQHVQLAVPCRFGVQYETRLKDVLAQNQAFLAAFLQYFAESGRQEGSSFGIYLGFYVTYKSHTYLLYGFQPSKIHIFHHNSPQFTTKMFFVGEKTDLGQKPCCCCLFTYPFFFAISGDYAVGRLGAGWEEVGSRLGGSWEQVGR